MSAPSEHGPSREDLLERLAFLLAHRSRLGPEAALVAAGRAVERVLPDGSPPSRADLVAIVRAARQSAPSDRE